MRHAAAEDDCGAMWPKSWLSHADDRHRLFPLLLRFNGSFGRLQIWGARAIHPQLERIREPTFAFHKDPFNCLSGRVDSQRTTRHSPTPRSARSATTTRAMAMVQAGSTSTAARPGTSTSTSTSYSSEWRESPTYCLSVNRFCYVFCPSWEGPFWQ